MIKERLSDHIITIHKKVRLKRGHKFTGEFKWVRCDRNGNDIDPEKHAEYLESRSSPLLFQRSSTLDDTSQVVSFKHSLQQNEMGNKEEAMNILNQLHEITINEADRIHKLYMTEKDFTVDNCMSLYKTLLVLFDEKMASREISRFFKEINVRLFLSFQI